MILFRIGNKGECIFILKSKLSYYTKKVAKIIIVIILGILLITTIINIKYKPVYEITLDGEKIGHISNVEEFQNRIKKEVIQQEGAYIADVSLIEEPAYNLKLLERTVDINEEEIIEKIKKEDTITTYKYYEVALNEETKSYVSTLEEAKQIVNEIKQEFSADELELNLVINEHHTENIEEINTETLEKATSIVEVAAQELKEESEVLATINDIKISVLPVSGRITSRYGESSSIRSSNHTGLDIACVTGTDIKSVADGKVICASYKGSYGNLVKIDHGNGVETWYAHCSKIYVNVGDEIKAGDCISAVGSTGNSTGPHLHFEIRINGKTVNPQNYVY